MFPEVWDRYGGRGGGLQNEIPHGAPAYKPGAPEDNQLTQRERSHRTARVTPSSVCCAFVHHLLFSVPQSQALAGKLEVEWELDGVLAGGPHPCGSQSSRENGPGVGSLPRHRAQLGRREPEACSGYRAAWGQKDRR